MSRSAERETSYSAFLFVNFFFAPPSRKEKVAKEFSCVWSFSRIVLQDFLAAFFFDTKGTKKKACKKEMPGIISPRARGEEGFAPSTCANF